MKANQTLIGFFSVFFLKNKNLNTILIRCLKSLHYLNNVNDRILLSGKGDEEYGYRIGRNNCNQFLADKSRDIMV